MQSLHLLHHTRCFSNSLQPQVQRPHGVAMGIFLKILAEGLDFVLNCGRKSRKKRFCSQVVSGWFLKKLTKRTCKTHCQKKKLVLTESMLISHLLSLRISKVRSPWDEVHEANLGANWLQLKPKITPDDWSWHGLRDLLHVTATHLGFKPGGIGCSCSGCSRWVQWTPILPKWT